jgi:cytochrome c-type biogenesis protein CcmE
MSGAGRKRKIGLFAGVAAVLVGFTYIVSNEIGDNLSYYQTPGEVVAMGERAQQLSLRMAGLVAANSVVWKPEELDLKFRVRDLDGTEVPVHANVLRPQMLQEGIEVVVEGRLTRAGVFEATNVMPMHSNEYRTLEDGKHPANVYRGIEREKS